MNWYLLIVLVLIADDCLGHFRSALLGQYVTGDIRMRLPRILRWLWIPRFKSNKQYDLYWSFYWALAFTLLIVSGHPTEAKYGILSAAVIAILYAAIAIVFYSPKEQSEPNHIRCAVENGRAVLTTVISDRDLAYITFDAAQLDGLIDVLQGVRAKLGQASG